MKRMKKIIVTILSLAMMMGLCVTVNAAESDQNYNEIYYTVYNENGEVVDEAYYTENYKRKVSLVSEYYIG